MKPALCLLAFIWGVTTGLLLVALSEARHGTILALEAAIRIDRRVDDALADGAYCAQAVDEARVLRDQCLSECRPEPPTTDYMVLHADQRSWQ